MRLYWIRLSPLSNVTGVLIREGDGNGQEQRRCDDTQGEDSNMEIEAEIEAISSQPRNARGHQNPEEPRKYAEA